MTSNKLVFSIAALLVACGPLACATDTSADEALRAEADADSVGTGVPVVVVPGAGATVQVKNGLSLTLNTELTWRTGASGKELVLHGSTSQNIVGVWGFIPDDGFGTPTQLGPRSFELAYSAASDLDTILSGERFFLRLQVTTTSGTHDYSAALGVVPQLVAVTGGATSTRLAFGAAITPEVVSDNPNGIHYRGTVTTTAIPQWLTVTAGAAPTLTQDGPHAWHFDWLYDGFAAAAQSGTVVEAKAKFGATTSTRDARIAVRLSDLELAATASPDDVWGFPTCNPTVAACVAALPAGTIDYSPCGNFRDVSICVF